MTENQTPLYYKILADTDPDALARRVTLYLSQLAGWKVHGDLKLQAVADPTSPTMSRLTYVQAIYRVGIPCGYD